MKDYYLGLDIGTNSVGYAVTDERFNLLKYKGEPMWGSHVFEEGKQCADRRGFRTARRRLDRRQQRVLLTQQIFAKAISEVDERFFIRIKESALLRDDTSGEDDYILFNDESYTDRDYHRDYPTIHHLIDELMKDEKPHDVRLVYIAVAWLVTHRGHFLSEVNKDNIDALLDFDSIYKNFMDFSVEKLWMCEDLEEFKSVLLKNQNIGNKEKTFYEILFSGKKPKTAEDDVISKAGVIKLLSGGTIDASKVFCDKEFEEKVSLSLKKSEEDFQLSLNELDEDSAEFMTRLRALYDWSVLVGSLHGYTSISKAKVEDYNQHKEDLKNLKDFVHKYCPEKFNSIFKNQDMGNYVSYVYNGKKNKRDKSYKSATQEQFCDFLKKKLKDIKCDSEDEQFYQDMMLRLETCSFMPKQVNGDNRVIPYQLYYYELKRILDNAEKYLLFLSERDEDGYSNKDKLLMIFEFRIPYFVGPINKNSEHAWFQRKAEGKIYPWNFEEKVDLDRSEEEFIKRMTNTCSYLPGETVLPKSSLLYCKFMVLNEINNIKINGISISVECKQGIFELFEKYRKVSVKRIKEYLISNGYMKSDDMLDGIDIAVKSSLNAYHDFKKLLSSHTLSEKDVERIIECITYSEDRKRILHRLNIEFPNLSNEDKKYLSKLKYTAFGRISKKFLTGIHGIYKETGEYLSIIRTLWETNDNLVQILFSDKYTFKQVIEEEQKDYYNEHSITMDTLLDEMYISNAVKRPIYRTLDVINDIKHTCKKAPEKIFVEMARGGGEKGKRTQSRKEQILELYKNFDKEEVRELSKELEGKEERELRSEALFLYFMQLGKSMYSGKKIDVSKLKTDAYNVDHIYPQSKVKDDSISNKVLVLSEENGEKADDYPIKPDIQIKMSGTWKTLLDRDLISPEKYRRLMRRTPFLDEEKMEFINRQIVETRQSTKAITKILKHIFPDTEIVYVKAKLVSDFRHEVLDLPKSRLINDFHHAKDAYLNIVVGAVYDAKFTSKFFNIKRDKYSLKTTTLFGNKVYRGKELVWEGGIDIDRVRKIASKNNIHYTRFAFERKGGLFDQQPVRAAKGLIERKDGLNTEDYGGYNKSTASCFMLAKYIEEGKKSKTEVMIVPVELMAVNKIMHSEASACEYLRREIAKIIGKSEDVIKDISLPLGMRKIKVNTILSLDGVEISLSGKSGGGKQIGISSMTSLVVDSDKEMYIKNLENFEKKLQNNKNLKVNIIYDKITREENYELYDALLKKIESGPYKALYSNQLDILMAGKEKFANLELEQQSGVLLNFISLFKTGRAIGCDFSLIGGVKSAGIILNSSKLSNWIKSYKDVRIIDVSAAGLHRKVSQNLLELL